MKQASRNDLGFTMVELMVALVIFTVVMAVALSFLEVQARGYRLGLERMSVAQTIRYAMSTLEEHLQTAGIHLAPGQPELVLAGADVVAFNADYATRTRNDLFAVFYDPDVEIGAVASVPRSRRFTIPSTPFQYPDTNYFMAGGVRSPAETITFFFLPDTLTPRQDDFMLLRQVNDRPPQLVARNLLRIPGTPFFRYFRIRSGGLDSIPNDSLPLFHSVAVHGSPADTGRASRIDSVKAVRVSLMATNGRTGDRERKASLNRLILLPNVGFGTLGICGSPPILGTSLSASLTTVEGLPAVSLTWGRSADEGGGENDVVRYVLFRRETGQSGWEDPYLSIPAGQTSYLYVDTNVQRGASYQYALAVQDCTPTLSSLSAAVTVVIPH